MQVSTRLVQSGERNPYKVEVVGAKPTSGIMSELLIDTYENAVKEHGEYSKEASDALLVISLTLLADNLRTLEEMGIDIT